MGAANKEDIQSLQLSFIAKILSTYTHEMKNHLAIIKESSGLMQDMFEFGKLPKKKRDAQPFLATLEAIDKPPSTFGPLLELFEQVLEHEQSVTAKIHKLMDQALSEKDHATSTELQWFVTEQVEEESNFSSWIKKLKMVGGDGRGVLMLDQEAAKRVFSPTALAE